MAVKNEKYIESIGRRKEAIARVRMFKSGRQSFTVNEKSLDEYFPTNELKNTAQEPLAHAKSLGPFKVVAKVKGGGLVAQAEAIRLGISRSLILFDGEIRKELKPHGFLKRDPRVKERKKFGLKGARRAPQWSKR
jgi:small subunit ribosomal protein S9|tara:strand:+ start:57253 stop:57657 length:405 start_codon:yes stop_codon:yes gene_type:complete